MTIEPNLQEKPQDRLELIADEITAIRKELKKDTRTPVGKVWTAVLWGVPLLAVSILFWSLIVLVIFLMFGGVISEISNFSY